MESVKHKLRRYVLTDTSISDSELDEVEKQITKFLYYEDSSRFVLTKNKNDREEFFNDEFQLVKSKKDILLSNGETIYFASDYGYAL